MEDGGRCPLCTSLQNWLGFFLSVNYLSKPNSEITVLFVYRSVSQHRVLLSSWREIISPTVLPTALKVNLPWWLNVNIYHCPAPSVIIFGDFGIHTIVDASDISVNWPLQLLL